jgi:MYXO-CTERM domain-containing protein
MRMRTSRSVAIVALTSLAWCLSPREAGAFCRTTTCPLPQGFSPSPGSCYPAGFVAYCASLMPPIKVLPLWWSGHCISYDLTTDAQGQVSTQPSLTYATASQIAADAFAKWTSTECTAGTNVGRVSIDVRDLGPVACSEVNYNTDQGNQHIIVFRDNGFVDANDPTGAVDPTNANTLGLTTVTFDPDTGELYDADMEINSSQPLATGDMVPPGGYDLQSIITHEAGHFLGLAHTGDAEATMFAQYTPGSTSKRILTDDDMEGICSIYLPDGTRAVDPSVAANGFVTESTCDATPRHGFQSACTSPQKGGGCAVAPEESASFPGLFGIVLAGAVGAVARRRQARKRRDDERI